MDNFINLFYSEHNILYTYNRSIPPYFWISCSIGLCDGGRDLNMALKYCPYWGGWPFTTSEPIINYINVSFRFIDFIYARWGLVRAVESVALSSLSSRVRLVAIHEQYFPMRGCSFWRYIARFALSSEWGG